jgi:hypothetical protein
MNKEINEKDDIFDIAIAIQYFNNMRSSSDDIHTFANHFLYKTVYKKLLSFSKEELETIFWDKETKEFHENPKAKHHEIRFSRNIFEAIYKVDNALFFAAFIEKEVFKDYYHPVVKTLIENKKSQHSLDFLQMLYNIQMSKKINEEKNIEKNFLEFDHFIFNFVKELDTEEKNEVFKIFIDNLIKKNFKDFVAFILNNIKSFKEEHLLILKSNIKIHNIDINEYELFEKKFPQITDNSFFISSSSHDFIDKAYDFGFRAVKYEYKNLNLPCAIYSHGLNGNNIGDTWQINFLKKLLKETSFQEVDKFIYHIGTDSVKLKKYGMHFENIAKEALNKKLQENLTELPKVKKSKI